MIDFLYFDNHSATKPFPEVLENFSRFSKEYWASSASPHFLGQQQSYPMQKSVESFFKEIGASDKDEVFFTSSGEEALYQVFLTAYFQRAKESGRTLFLIPETEEVKALAACKKLEELGCSFQFLKVNGKGQITREVLESAITPRTALVSLSWANGLTGVLQPLADLAEVCREKGVLFHVDASYVWGKSFFRFQDLGVDFLSLDGSVLHSPKESGLVLVKAGIKAEELIPGKVGESAAKVAAFTKALEMMHEKFEFYCMEISRLRDRFEEGVCKQCEGALVLFKDADRLPVCTVIAFPPINSESFLFLLNTKGVYASIGSGKFQKLTEVLKATGISEENSYSALSFCLSYDMDEAQVDRAIEIVSECFKRLKECAGEL
jgi:cysteine desulfurase